MPAGSAATGWRCHALVPRSAATLPQRPLPKVRQHIARDPKAMQQPPVDAGPGTEFQLVVWTRPGLPWRARIVAADRSEQDFSDPFELARFLSSPRLPRAGRPTSGLR